MRYLIKLADWLSRGIIYAFVFLVLIAAAFSSLFRYYLPQLEQHQVEILDYINQRSGEVQIHAERISSDWQNFKPEFNLYGVKIRTPGWDEALHLQKLDLRLDVLRSLYHRTVYFDHIEIAQLELLLVQNEEGKWSLSGIKGGERQPMDLDKLIEHLWAIDELDVHQLYLQLQPWQKPRIKLPFLQVTSNTILGNKHVETLLIDGNRHLARAVVEAQGEPLSDEFTMQAYVQIKDYLPFDLFSMLPGDVSLQSAKLSSELWLALGQGTWQLDGQVELSDLLIEQGEKQWQLQSLNARLAAEYGDGLQLWIPELSLQHKPDSRPFSLEPLMISKKDGLQVRSQGLELGSLNQLLAELPLPQKLQGILQTLAPEGRLDNVLIASSAELPFSLTAHLNQVSVSPWQGAPGLTNVSGVIYTEKLYGKVYLDTDSFSMAFPKLYDNPMVFEKAGGEVYWKIGEERLDIGGYGLQLDGEYGLARGEFYLDLPRIKGEGEPPRMSLAIGLRNSAARHRNAFIPRNLDKNLLNWLDNSIHQAQIPVASYIYHGPTITNTEEILSNQLWLDIQQGRLKYLPEWPAVESIDGEFLLDNDYSFAELDSAATAGVQASSAQVRLSPAKNGPRIDIDLSVRSSAESVLGFLQTPVLSQQMSGVLDEWKIDRGEVVGEVSISTLINAQQQSPDVSVSAELSNVDLAIPEFDLGVERITGPLNFSLDRGLSSAGLKGRFWGEPMSARIHSRGGPGKLNTRISFFSAMDMRDLQRWSKQPVFAFTQGKTPVKGEIYYGDAGAGLRLNSQLKNIAVELPQPLLKTADKERSLDVHLPFSGENRELVVGLGKGVEFRFRLGEKGLDAGQINLGINRSQYTQNKIVVGGQLLKADAEQWIEVVQRYEKILAAQPAVDEVEGSHWTLSVEQLRIRELTAYGQTLEQVDFDLFNTVAYWQLAVNHQHLKASLRIHDDTNLPMKAHLNWVNLEFLSDKQEQSGIGFTDPALIELPDIDFEIDRLIWDGEDFGEWEFQLRSYVDHMALENIESSFRHLRLGPDWRRSAELSWGYGDDARTRFVGRFAGDNLADALKAWGYSQELNSESAQFDVDVSWQGGPLMFAMNHIEGQSQFELLKGNFADAQSGSTDALKLIGVFNLARIVRRLKLDFSDLTQTGLAYDKVSGQVKMKAGIYNFDTPLVVKGASSDIRFQGAADINKEELDMSMGVTLPLASNLPWVVAIAGGLPTAAGVYLISKLLKKQVDKLSSVVYKLEGSFSDPQLEFLKLFDDELPDALNLDELEVKSDVTDEARKAVENE